jgi:cellulose synthase/poly-beta-1,6-N-acetylglucosamine synthase-like glycosyltransferase
MLLLVVIDIVLGSIPAFFVVSFCIAGAAPLYTRGTLVNGIPKTKFLVLVPAYNEENVIANSISTIKAQNYPKELFELVLICNGTDNTASIATDMGARVLQTPTPACGKSKAIEFALASLSSSKDERYLLIFDADNMVDASFLRAIDAEVQETKAVACQGYHMAMIANKSWVSWALYVAYCASSRLYNLGRDRLLHSALICGTGYCVREDIFRNLWPKVRTQTEDIELNGLLQQHYGEGVSWVTDAKFYDEKPDSLDIAFKQRVRWMAGHFRCMIFYTPKLLLHGLVNRSIRSIELAFYYATPLFLSVSLAWYLVLFPYLFVTDFESSHTQGLLALSLFALGYILLTPIFGFLLTDTKQSLSGYKLVDAIAGSIYAVLFSIIVWPPSLALACLSIFREDWIFHTPHKAINGMHDGKT